MEKNISTLVQGACITFDSKAAFRWRDDVRWKEMTYSELAAAVEQIGRGLISLGVQPGDRVAIFSPNRYEWALADIAIMSVGAVTVPIYATSAADTVRFILLHSEAKVLFTGNGACLSTVAKIRDEIPGLEHLICFDIPATSHGLMDLILMEDLNNRGSKISPKMMEERIHAIRGDDLSTIIYTSGTTGDPKGVMLTHTNIFSNVEASLSQFHVTAMDSSLSFLPLSHALERTAGLYLMLHAGVTIHFAEDIQRVADNLREVKPTVMISVPRLLEKFRARVLEKMADRSPFIRWLFQRAIQYGKGCVNLSLQRRGVLYRFFDRLFYSKIRDVMGGNLRLVVSGGAALSSEVANFFQAVGIPVTQGYGLTETSPVACVNILAKNKIGTVGPPIPGVEIKIASDGEVLIKGPCVMKGYYKNPQATNEAFTADGYFKTGDVGELDSDGYLRITDRKKELIVTSGGKNVAPQPLENELKLDPLVEQVCLVGDGRNYLAALIVPNFPELEKRAKAYDIGNGGRDRLVNHPLVRSWYDESIKKFNERQARYETIKRFALLPDEWTIDRGEITPTLKLRRKIIQKKYSDLIESLYS